MRVQLGTIRTNWALALIACALALRLFIAPGWMPAMGAQGVTVTLCTAEGAVEIALPGKSPLRTAHDPCPFGALALAPLLPDVLAAGAVLLPAAAPTLIAPVRQRPHLGVPAPPPPPTGPPFTLG